VPLQTSLFTPKEVPLFESPQIPRVSHFSAPETTDIFIFSTNNLEIIISTCEPDQNGRVKIGHDGPGAAAGLMAGSEWRFKSHQGKRCIWMIFIIFLIAIVKR